MGATLLLASIAGVAGTMYLWYVQRPVLRERYGIQALATLPAGDYAGRLRQALLAQGLVAPPDALAATARWPDELLLLREGRPVLLLLHVDPDDLVGVHEAEELAHAVHLRGLDGGIVTLGTVDRRARADAPGLELVDGPTVWRWLASTLPARLARQVERQASVAFRRRALTVWALLIAATVAVASVARIPSSGSPTPAAARVEVPSA